MPSPKPITLTAGANPNPSLDPEPMVVVGDFPTATKAEVTALTPVTAANAVASVADPTKAEFDALVTLANANKTKINAIIAALKA